MQGTDRTGRLSGELEVALAVNLQPTSFVPRDGELLDLNLAVLLELLSRREISPVEVAEASLARIRERDGRVSAFCSLREKTTREMAHASESRYASRQPMGLIDGVPVAIKDELTARGWITRAGSRLSGNTPDEVDAPSVAACRRNGFVPVGKTTCPEFGWKAVTDSPLTGITRNPWDPDKTPGGSSGGSAVAVALGMATAALGVDSGGSIRIPASFCGIVGFKPTQGSAPTHLGSHYGQLSSPGPMGRTVRDVAMLLDVTSQPDPRYERFGSPQVRYRDEISGGVTGMRIAYSPSLLSGVRTHPEIEAATREVATVLEELGARVEEAAPELPGAREAFERLFFGASAFLARNDVRVFDVVDVPRVVEASEASFQSPGRTCRTNRCRHAR